jgi:tetratricopeptide (TPR) repeat protein
MWGQDPTPEFQNWIRDAIAKQQAGQFEAAANSYRAALKLEPADVATHVNLGIVLVQLGHFEEALEQYGAAEKVLPGDERIERNIGLAYKKSGRFKEARETFERLHNAFPQDAQLTMLLADLELQLGNNKRVIELLQPMEVVGSNDAGLAYMLGIAQFGSGNLPAAVKELGQAAAESDSPPAGLEALYGRVLLMTGDPEAASAAFTKELNAHPDNFEANLGKAQIGIARRTFAEAGPFATRALAARKEDPYARLAKAQCLVAESRFLEARPLAETAALALQDSIEAHQTLADVYNGMQLGSKASAERKKVVALRAAADPGPEEGELAPDFTLGNVSLRKLRAKGPVVLVFGSYSCPNFRDAVPALKQLYGKYGVRASFQMVYVREAHTVDGWQSGRNAREGDFVLKSASTLAEKQDHAAMCARKLHLPFPSAVDGMDGAVEEAYRAWPSRIFVVGSDGRVMYDSRLTEFDFHPDQIEQLLQETLR